VLRLTENPEPTKARAEILSSLSEIFINIERLIDYLMKKGRDEAGWLGALAGILVWFFGVIGLFVVNLLADIYATKYFIEHPGSSFVYLGFLLILSVPIGLITYFYAKKRYTEEYIPWKNALHKLKKAVTENKAEEVSIIEKTLQLIDQTTDWLPNLMEYRSEEALTYGLVAFLLATLVSADSAIGMPIAVLVGVMVWLYFRYEKRKETDQQIKELKAWRRKFEKEKGNFLKSV
jgi:hypothetical protein